MMKVYILFYKWVFCHILQGIFSTAFVWGQASKLPISFYPFLHVCQAFPRLQPHSNCVPVIQLINGYSKSKCASLLLCLSLIGSIPIPITFLFNIPLAKIQRGHSMSTDPHYVTQCFRFYLKAMHREHFSS